jgi:fructokinase
MIAVAGEALIDLVVQADGRVDARLGGGPCNTARTLSRLGAPVLFLGGLAADPFGRRLRGQLAADGVMLGPQPPSAQPSTLAVAALDAAGIAGYSFYLDGTAAAEVPAGGLRAALPPGLSALCVGSLGLVMEPIGTAVQQLVAAGVPTSAGDGRALVLLDPNCRPGAVPDAAAYRARVSAVARRADVVKASVEDLHYLYPEAAPGAAANALLGLGTRLVLVTDGPRPARAFLPGAVLAAAVPEVTVADTIGAGDTFGGAFLAWWTACGLGRAELSLADAVSRALRAAVTAAALSCARPGADPPGLAEVRATGGWPPPVA